MARSLNDKMRSLPKGRQDTIQKRADQLIAEEMTLRDLRLALEKTQEDLGAILHMKQDGISRLEKRSDMLISTLSKYISAMGGSLKLMAEFPDRAPVEIHGIADIKSH
ncbi:helix-turn-helix domain-containing protein [Legionella hackeliae]|uniref:Putative transcriptional regulator, XRE family n=1 Tax=Legionella hackeliae TaxID=449 RepID=A0A0A8UXG9_LEGHA|nr:helix-turn-helix transcriptional regulator [Legionella hackeliae]KTD09880.1 putative transcriptional regulator, XRE family [Legionella hackeliae]CEK11822.1 putative transcriptional regulator, XRE family [Legionella hackeliae]STX48589.1 putative transcriptional regulator, XRE family [Legionella hackeliae]